MKIVYVGGKARAGKDTTAEFAKEKLESMGYKVLITHYGDLVKYVCKTFFDWDGVKDENGRTILQTVGTDIFRTSIPTFWIDFVRDVITVCKEKWDYVFIPDCRFPNELNIVNDSTIEQIYLRIIRPNYDNGLTEEQKKHISEVALDGVEPDYLVTNSGTLNELECSISKWIEENVNGK